MMCAVVFDCLPNVSFTNICIFTWCFLTTPVLSLAIVVGVFPPGVCLSQCAACGVCTARGAQCSPVGSRSRGPAVAEPIDVRVGTAGGDCTQREGPGRAPRLARSSRHRDGGRLQRPAL